MNKLILGNQLPITKVDLLFLHRTQTVCEDVPARMNFHPAVDYMAYERVSITVKYLMDRTYYRPKIAIICGSGLGK